MNISKKGTQFTPAENIEYQSELIFKHLKECNYFKGLSHGEFVEEIVDFYCITNPPTLSVRETEERSVPS